MKTIKKTAIIIGAVFGVLAIGSSFSHDIKGLVINLGVIAFWITVYKLISSAEQNEA